MARVLTSPDGITHLRGAEGTLCGEDKAIGSSETESVLTCKECATIALRAVELVTKKEKRLWREL